ncbi:hypothetical protein P7C73_g970, partial [Tremellales sp. Uapishka_1]
MEDRACSQCPILFEELGSAIVTDQPSNIPAEHYEDAAAHYGPAVVPMEPKLVLCADGGGSKVCVGIRGSDGLEFISRICLSRQCLVARDISGSIISSSISLASRTAPFRHLARRSQLISTFPPSRRSQYPFNFAFAFPVVLRCQHTFPSTSSPRSSSKPEVIQVLLARFGWHLDPRRFGPHAVKALGVERERIKITNDVNLLAAPAFNLPRLAHVVAVVAGTGTVGRTMKVNRHHNSLGNPTCSLSADCGLVDLPLEDEAVSRGWGHITPPPPVPALHSDLLLHFDITDSIDLLEVVSLTGPLVDGLSTGEATAKRNAHMAGAARVVLHWAFPEPDSPQALSSDLKISQMEALRLVDLSIQALVELTLSLLGDRSIVDPSESALALGGGLMMCAGYREKLLESLKSSGVMFGAVLTVTDAAGAGAIGLAKLGFRKVGV